MASRALFGRACGAAAMPAYFTSLEAIHAQASLFAQLRVQLFSSLDPTHSLDILTLPVPCPLMLCRAVAHGMPGFLLHTSFTSLPQCFYIGVFCRICVAAEQLIFAVWLPIATSKHQYHRGSQLGIIWGELRDYNNNRRLISGSK